MKKCKCIDYHGHIETSCCSIHKKVPKKECKHKVISSSTLEGKLNNLNCVDCGKDFIPNIKPKIEINEEEIKNIGIDLVEEYFPKGKCKERGQAIVLYAQLIIKFIDLLKTNKLLVEKKKIKIYHDISCNCYDCRNKVSLKAKD